MFIKLNKNEKERKKRKRKSMIEGRVILIFIGEILSGVKGSMRMRTFHSLTGLGFSD